MSGPAVFADPRNDFTFKRIFGSEDRKDVLIAFLDDLLGLDARHRIVDVHLLSPELRPIVPELKYSVVDALCRDIRGVTYVIEMQVLQVEGFEKRIVYNVAKSYVHQLQRADPYPRLNDVIGVTITDFEVWPDDGERRIPMLSRWQMTEQQTGVPGLGQLRFVFLELPKYDASRPPRTMIEKWAYFFREAHSLAAVPDLLADHPFVDALEAARVARYTVADWDAHILTALAIQDRHGMIAFAERRGHELGLLHGQELGEQRGERLGRERGQAEGLRQGVEMLCHALGIELTDDRKRDLARLDVPGLTALMARLGERRSWT